jgi:hypothetical protein
LSFLPVGNIKKLPFHNLQEPTNCPKWGIAKKLENNVPASIQNRLLQQPNLT